MTTWLNDTESRAWRGLQLMQLQLTAALSRELSERTGLSYRDYLVLAVLSERPEGRMRAFELGRELGWEKSRLSHHISRMADRRLVERQKCTSDRRGAFVAVTPAGRKAIEEAAPGHVAAVRRRFVDHLTPDQLHVLTEISDTVLAGLESECDVGDD